MAPVPVIRSLRNPGVAFTRSLRRASVRRRSGRTFVEGPKLVAEALAADVVERVLWTEDAAKPARDLAACAERVGIPVRQCTTSVFATVSDTETPQGVLAVIRIPNPPKRVGPALLLVLDRVQDPGNVGTMLRAAAAAAATGTVCGRGSADPYGPKAMRAGAGAQLHLPLVQELPSSGLRIFAAEPDGRLPYTDVNWTVPVALVIGGEGPGISPEMRERAHATVGIPIAPDIESLNASAAGAVILFEAARQRRMTESRDSP